MSDQKRDSDERELRYAAIVDDEERTNGEEVSSRNESEDAENTKDKQPASKRKLSRKERKEAEKRQLAREKELIRTGQIPPRIQYKSHHTLGRILSVCVAFFLGIFFAIGGLIGTIAIVGTQFKVKDVLSGAGMDPDEVLTDSAAEMSILELAQTVLDDFKELGGTENFSISFLDKYTPAADKMLQSVSEQLAVLGVHLNLDEFKSKPFNEYGTYFQQTVIPALTLADALSVTDDENSDPILRTLCYKADGSKTTVGDLQEGAFDYFKTIALADLLSIEPDSGNTLMNAVCYKANGEKTTLGDFIDDGSNILLDMQFGAALGLDGNNDPLMLEICYGKAGTDYTVDASGKIVPAEGSSPTTLRDLSEGATGVLGTVTLETLLSTNGASDASLRFLAYGSQTETTKDAHGNEITTVRYTIDPVTKAVTMNAPYSKKTLDDFRNSDSELIGGAKIGDLVTIDANASGMLRAIADWKIDDLKDQSKLESLRLSEVLDIGNDATGFLGALRNNTLAELKDQNTMNSLKIGEVLDLDENATGLMGAIRDWTLDDMRQQKRVERLKIKQILTDADDSLLIQAIGDWRICDLSDQKKTDTLSLGKVIEIDETSPLLLQAIADTPLGALNATMNGLRLCDFLSDEDLNDNNILKQLKMSTIDSLATDVSNITVAQLFGDELYCYLSKQDTLELYRTSLDRYLSGKTEAEKTELMKQVGVIETGTYEELLNAYEKNRKISELSRVVPVNVSLSEREKIETTRVVTGTNTLVQIGYFAGRRLVDEKDVHKNPDGGYYTLSEYALSPVYGWTKVTYVSGGSTALGGVIAEEDGHYYYTPEGSELEFAVEEDDFGYYYIDGNEKRVDLERSVTGYAAEGTPLSTDANGNVVLDGISYPVRVRGTSYYILRRTPVERSYYAQTGSSYRRYTDEEVSERYEKVYESGQREELDRYLGGVWYYLFGGEETGEDGRMTIIDRTDRSVLTITADINTVPTLFNKRPLWDLYFHEFIESNPYHDIARLNRPQKNLNELTITQMIQLFRDVTA